MLEFVNISTLYSTVESQAHLVTCAVKCFTSKDRLKLVLAYRQRIEVCQQSECDGQLLNHHKPSHTPKTIFLTFISLVLRDCFAFWIEYAEEADGRLTCFTLMPVFSNVVRSSNLILL